MPFRYIFALYAASHMKFINAPLGYYGSSFKFKWVVHIITTVCFITFLPAWLPRSLKGCNKYITLTANLNSTACSTWVVLPARLSLWLHQQLYGSLPRPNPSPWVTARLSFVLLFMIGLVECLFCNDNSIFLSWPGLFLQLYMSP
jgi:hypothetical protein